MPDATNRYSADRYPTVLRQLSGVLERAKITQAEAVALCVNLLALTIASNGVVEAVPEQLDAACGMLRQITLASQFRASLRQNAG